MKYILLIILIGSLGYVSSTSQKTCNSRIFCCGPLLHTVQTSGIFKDSKTFVDMQLKRSYSLTLMNFQRFMFDSCDNPSKTEIKKFIDSHFEESDELIEWKPSDYKEKPPFLNRISDSSMKDFAKKLNQIWPKLARKIKSEVQENPSMHSIIPLPKGFIIPGGRFTEYYYWDSYWIIKGLILCDMKETAKGMIENFFYLIQIYGFIPNGGRIYFCDRSEPPLLAKMVLEYYKCSQDKVWLKKNIKYLDMELQFWLDQRTVVFKSDHQSYTLAQYGANSTGPRPEAYIEDYKLVSDIPNSSIHDQVYTDIRASAESGWDLSSRWVIDSNGGNNDTQRAIATSRIIPVDLNAYLCEAFKIISGLYLELGKRNKANFWNEIGNKWQRAIKAVLWDRENGTWYDFDTRLKQRRRYFYASNLAPLWCGCLKLNDTAKYGQLTYDYLKRIGALGQPGGIAVSLVNSSEQWDYPNAWPPMQELIIEALDKSSYPPAVTEAKNIAEKWLKSNMKAFSTTCEMYEKYDALEFGKRGRGDDYPTQPGFGWTNGVALSLISKYYRSTNKCDCV